jgi:OPA family glycerol-3-phosphate transporter-like MFS transporter
LLKKVFANRLMLTIAFIGLAVGVLRNGIMNWYLIYAKEVKQTGAEYFVTHWGLLLCVFGIIGGFAGGAVSDKFFQSRRGPPVAILFAMMLAMAVLMFVCVFSSPRAMGVAAMVITMAATGATSLMSGTAAPDFGGRKATATCAGITDGFVYLGSGLQSWGIGYLTGLSWVWWPVFLMPFALLGGILAVSIWNELPAATRKFIREVEQKPVD